MIFKIYIVFLFLLTPIFAIRGQDTMDVNDYLKYIDKISNKDYEGCVKFLKEQLIKYPKDPEIYSSLSFCYAQQEKYDIAIEFLDVAIQIDKSKISFHADLASYYYRSGQYQTSTKKYSYLIDQLIAKTNPDVAKQIPSNLDSKNKTIIFENKLKLDTIEQNLLFLASAYIGRGWCKYSLDDFNGSISDYDSGILVLKI